MGEIPHHSFYFTLSFGVHASEGAKLAGRGLRLHMPIAHLTMMWLMLAVVNESQVLHRMFRFTLIFLTLSTFFSHILV